MPENGQQIGHYKILSAIGAGGMGEVFLAEDVRLNRKVALKLLPEKLLGNADGLNRFIQEAKSASALNHPNIITVHDIGESEGKHFIAVEFIDGQTLRERMAAGRISFDEILSILIQTAEALSAAHQAGIVHRDIKPENIMIRKDGYVKVLDFGLAKLSEQNGSAKAEAEDLTRKLVKTNPGVVMGTAAYMSPEQALGKEVDARSDVFSFGVLMYEILAGQTPFTGETMMEVVQSVINSEPQPLQSLAPHLPKELVRITHKTLKKKREQRYHSTRDLLNDLKDLRDELQQESILGKTAVPDKSEKPETNATSAAKLSTNSSGRIKDALLLTEFENATGEAIFDQTLKIALAFSLAQSPFLDIFPEAKVSHALRLMGRLLNERVTKELGYEICLRQGLKAFITGTISSFGTTYVLTLEAVNARTGESLGRQFEQVTSREEVLTALSQAATGLREQLGESLSSIERYDVPIEYITTSSLEALKFYTLGTEQVNTGKTLESIPFYKKALEIDDKFSSVYMGLAVLYANTGQMKLAAETIVRAFELRGTASENEKLRIEFFYYSFVTGEIDKALGTLDLWRKTYPSHIAAVINLSDLLERTGQSEKAVSAAREGLRLDTNHAVLYMNLAESLLSLDRYAEIKETCQKAFEKKFDGDYFHQFLYIVAFIEQDAAAMAEHLAWFSSRADEYLALNLQTGTGAFQGQWRKAQDLARRSIDLASRSDAREVAGQYAAEQALRIVFWSSGTGLPKGDESQLKTVLKTQTNKALNLERGKDVMTRAALALAIAGQTAEANSLADEVHAEYPKATLLNQLWLPMIRGAILLQSGKAKEAIEELEIVERYEKAGEFYSQYLRGLAYLQLNKPKSAVKEFDKILNHRGEAPLSSVYPLAQLGKARATEDKSEYEKFFELWKDADKDMPALIEAKKEYEILV
jgi:serine/threonine protein kinase/Flp pilus assembly protein TadD